MTIDTDYSPRSAACPAGFFVSGKSDCSPDSVYDPFADNLSTKPIGRDVPVPDLWCCQANRPISVVLVVVDGRVIISWTIG